jgi:hypothetical protein
VSFWLVGEAPTPETVGHPELWLLPDDSGIPHSANKLFSLTGWSRRLYVAIFDHRTTVWQHPQRIWIDEGRRKAAKIAEESMKAGTLGVLILGNKAAEAFWMAEEEPLVWVGRFCVIPHPSGRCRFWSQPGAHERARVFFKELQCKHESMMGGSRGGRSA